MVDDVREFCSELLGFGSIYAVFFAVSLLGRAMRRKVIISIVVLKWIFRMMVWRGNRVFHNRKIVWYECLAACSKRVKIISVADVLPAI